MRALTIGGATQDIFFTTQDGNIKRLSRDHQDYLMIPEGAKLIMDDAHLATGGGATNAAAALTMLDIDTDVCCKVGNDTTKQFVINDLKSRGIGCDTIQTTDETQTALSCIIPSPTGDRTIFVYRGANAYFTPDDLPNAIQQYDGTYITSLAQSSAQYIDTIAQTVHSQTKFVAHNPGEEEIEQHPKALQKALSHIDIFILNAHEARAWLRYIYNEIDNIAVKEKINKTDTTPELLRHFDTINGKDIDIRYYMHAIMHLGPTTVIITNGSEGVYVGHENTVYFGKAPSVDVMCSVGAGDAFGSTFFGYRLLGESITDAIRCGIINSCSVLQTPDAKQGCKLRSELSQYNDITVASFPMYMNAKE